MSRARAVARSFAHNPMAFFHLKMPSIKEAVAPAVERILDAVESAALLPERRIDLAVALSEALSNAAEHGHHLDSSKNVLIAGCSSLERGCVIDIRNAGPGFDFAAVGDCTHEERLLSPRGRGIFMMQRLVDALEYNTAGTRVRLWVSNAPPRS
jgi:serine/threonine-protein kinase RsbW